MAVVRPLKYADYCKAISVGNKPYSNDDGVWLQRAMSGAGFQGGVAGGIPPHKGGPQARPPKSEERGKRSEK